MDHEERARIEEEVRRSEDELATMSNSCGCCAAIALSIMVLVVGVVSLAWRSR